MDQNKPTTQTNTLNPTKKTNKFVTFLSKKPPKKRLIIVSSSALGLLLAGGAITQFYAFKDPAPVPVPVLQKVERPVEPIYTLSPLTGLETTPEASLKPVVGVMVENSIDARPQSGLEEAGIVFEAIAEGGITRFLALFQEANPANIGPIRSARPYYVQWVRGFDAAYVHSGGSGEALALIRQIGVKDLDHGAFGEKIASRVSNRYAPHNVYTSMDRIRGLASAQGYTAASTFTPLTRITATKHNKEEKTPELHTHLDEATEAAAVPVGSPATKIQFNISSANYNTAYSYRAETKDYARNMGGIAHSDQESGKQITPEVVVALIMPYSIHPDRVHSAYGNIGSGQALVFQNGTVITANWSKASNEDSLKLTDTAGLPLPLVAGQIWFTAVPDGRVTHTP